MLSSSYQEKTRHRAHITHTRTHIHTHAPAQTHKPRGKKKELPDLVCCFEVKQKGVVHDLHDALLADDVLNLEYMYEPMKCKNQRAESVEGVEDAHAPVRIPQSPSS